VEREAFARARRFLNYQPVAKWIALTAAVITAFLYVALLVLLGLFVDLIVYRGAIPSYQGLSPTDRDHFQVQWLQLLQEERQDALEKVGLASSLAAELSKVEDLPALPPADRELLWRAYLDRTVMHRVGPVAAAIVLPEWIELSPRAQQSFLQTWSSLPEPSRKERLDQSDVEGSVALARAEPAQLPSSQQELLWRTHQRFILNQTDPEAAEAYWIDRQSRAPGNGAFSSLADRGILSLIVRSRLRIPDMVYAPALGGLARLVPWTWRTGSASRSNATYYLAVLAVLAILVLLIRGIALFTMGYSAARATIEATNRLRRAIYHHTYRLGTLAFRALGPSEAVGIFTRQLEGVHDALYAWLTVLCREPVKFFLLLAFALALNVWLALAFLIFALLVWLIGGQVATYYRRQERAGTRRAAEQLAMLQESLMMMRLVKGFLMDLFNQARVERQLANYADAQMRRYRGEAIYRPLLISLGTLAAVVLLFVAGEIVLRNRLGVPRAITLATALVSLYPPLVHWLEDRRYLRRGRAAASIVFKFLDRPGEVGQVVGAEFLAPLSSRLEFDDVSLKEPGTGRILLDHITFTIQAGQRIAIVGPEEMEKHALIYLIPRLLDPDSGEIRIDQHNLRWVTFDSLRAQIGVVLQHNLVFNDTVANNIGCGDPSYDLPKVIEAAKIAHAHHFIQKLPKGYETQVGEMGHPLNTGERFRIALARAILRDPALLIIEEPAIVLDDDTKSLLDDTFSRVLPSRTVIFLPHRISTIRSCDRIFLINKGRVEAAGEHRELLTQSELYRHLQYLEFNVFAEHT
jgi:ATP-binding cassette subfamily B protein